MAQSAVISPSSLTFGPLNADTNEVSDWQAVTIKTPVGYVSTGTWTVNASGTSDAKYQLATANDGSGTVAYGAPLTGNSTINAATGITVYVRAKAESGESATTVSGDTSCTLSIACDVLAA